MADATNGGGGVVVNGAASSAANSVNGREKVEMVPPADSKGDSKTEVVKGEKIPQLREQTGGGRSRDNVADVNNTPNIKSSKGVASSRPSSRGADRLVLGPILGDFWASTTLASSIKIKKNLSARYI